MPARPHVSSEDFWITRFQSPGHLSHHRFKGIVVLPMGQAPRMTGSKEPLSVQICLEPSALASANQVPLHLDAVLGTTRRDGSN